MTIEQTFNLAVSHYQAGRLAEAEALLRGIVDVARRPEWFVNLGVICDEQEKPREAIEAYQQALKLRPEFAEAHNNLGNAHQALGEVDEAMAAYRRALAIAPGYAQALNHLANVCKEIGRVIEADGYYRESVRLAPFRADLDSNRIYNLLFDPRQDAASLLAEHQGWNQRHVAPVAMMRRMHGNSLDSARRLRIGYVSPFFRRHVVGYNIAPLLRLHDREQFEVFIYSDVRRPDEMTERFRTYVDAWRDVGGLDDQRCAELIAADRIDILIDLALHMGGNRLLVFARKPAPVQITFAGYPGGTGLTAMDWRLTEAYLDPPGKTDGDYVERSFRLPNSFWCYDPAEAATSAPASPLPAMQNGYVTFGCLNNYCKVNDAVVDSWAGVLRAVPRSRLLLLAPVGSARKWLSERMSRHGVESARLDFNTPLPRQQYIEQYARIDIGLDTFPYNGHSTSLDSLWMGVPVVTRIGKTVVGRAGWSQLSNLGLTDLAASGDDEFVRIAAGLANDLERLADLRRGLRDRMLASPLTNASAFTSEVEAAYRQIWPKGTK